MWSSTAVVPDRAVIMRKLILVIAIAVAVAIGFSLSTLRATVSRGAQALATAVADGTSDEVSVGDVSLSLFPLPSAAINDVSVSTPNRRNQAARPVLDIPLLRVRPKLLPLLVGQVVVDSVEAVDSVLYVRREAGAGRFETFLPKDAAAKLSELGFPVDFVNATLHYSDSGRPQPLSVDVVDLNFTAIGRPESKMIDPWKPFL